MKTTIEEINFDERGLVPAIVQDAATRRVLMLAYVNAESLRRTLETGETWFWSRSRNKLWHKGETSGNTQSVAELTADCDNDALLVLVEPAGPACHTGATSCFCDELQERGFAAESGLDGVLDALYRVVQSRKRDRPDGSYTAYLFEQGLDKILKKVGEELSETIIAAKNEDRAALVGECADLLYHLIVLMVERGLTLDEVGAELTRRRKDGQ